MSKRVLFVLVIVGMLLGTVWLFKDLQTTPSGSLYYLGKAIYNHDSHLFFDYIDYQRIVGGLQPEASKEGGFLAQAVRNAFAGLNEHGEQYLRKIIEDRDRPNLPGSLALLLAAQQGQPLNGQVEIMLPPMQHGGRPLHFTMSQYGNMWKVTAINSRDLQWLLMGYLGIAQAD